MLVFTTYLVYNNDCYSCKETNILDFLRTFVLCCAIGDGRFLKETTLKFTQIKFCAQVLGAKFKMDTKQELNRRSQSGAVSKRIDDGQKFLKVLNTFPFYVILVDEDHHILLANEAVISELEVEPEEVIGSYCPKLIHGVDRPIPDCPVEEASEKQKSVERECFNPKSGQWFKSVAYPIENINSNGKTIFLHMIQDISAQKQVQKEKEQAVIEERTGIARDMHDGILQNLYSLSLKIDFCRRTLKQKGKDVNRVTQTLEEVSENLQANIEGMRRVIFNLKPFDLNQGIFEALRNLTSEFEAYSQMQTEVELKGEISHLPFQLEYILFRVAQEALANVGKHSQATKVWVKMDFTHPERIQLEIKDNGQGFDNSLVHWGMGIENMAERIKEMGGSLKLTSTPGKGTEVKAILPLARGFK